MRNGIFYLNNNGSRWVVYDNGKKTVHEFLTTNGETVKRTAIFYESFGNFAIVQICWKGKKINLFLDAILKN